MTTGNAPKPDEHDSQVASVPIDLSGKIVDRACVYETRIWHPDELSQEGRPIRAIIDTGATAHAIRTGLIEDLDLPSFSTRRVRFAGGERKAMVHTGCVELQMGRLSNWGVAPPILELIACPDIVDDVIIGMNILDDGVLRVNGRRKKWRLSARIDLPWPFRLRDGGVES